MHASSEFSRRKVNRRTFLRRGGAALTVTAACQQSARAVGTEERRDLDTVFREHGAAGTFVLYDPAADHTVTVNSNRAAQRYVPASSFKITNSLIALETGMVRDENEVVPYGGKPQPIKAWERDMSMREAIAISNVPVYQEIARRVGLARYREWLAQLNYGNAQMGDVVDRFWLDGPLEISAMEQTSFLAALTQQKLPASARSQSIVRDIVRLEASGGGTLYGKTGWQFSRTPQLGWWVGWVERDGKPMTFALNMDMGSDADAPKRIAIGKAMLGRLGVY